MKSRSKVRSAAVATACALSMAVAAPALAVSGWLGSDGVAVKRITVRQGTLAATPDSDAGRGIDRASPAPVSAAVGFSFWAQGRVGPLSLVVFSHNDARSVR